MENNKQSSVEQFWQDVQDILPSSVDTETGIKLVRAFEQAKAMHKEELLNIFNCGRNFQATGEGTFNEIYNEIYGKDNADNTAV